VTRRTAAGPPVCYSLGVVRSAVILALALAACSARPADPRDRYRQPDKVMAALGLRAGQRVADVGAGRGYLTFRLAEGVGPGGRVVATDIDDDALAALRAHRPAAANVDVRKVAPDDPGLERGGFDLILLAEVDQYLPDRVDYLNRLEAALAPGGRVAVLNRLPFRAPLLAAADRAGLVVQGELHGLEGQYLVLLARR
jgi:predicted methyltransferase